MTDNNHIELTNQKSYVNEKFNLNTNDQNEIFIIPTFTLITTPVLSAENESCYELFFQVAYIYNKFSEKKTRGNLANLIFQYDLNFSKETEGRGQIALFSSIQFILFPGKNIAISIVDSSSLKKHESAQFLPSLNLKIFKILLPIKAVKKDDINVLHYSFNGEKDYIPGPRNIYANKNLHIDNKNNSGTLSFYINDNPNYQLQSIPKILSKEINILTIKNPLVFQTFIPIINNEYYFSLGKNPDYGLVYGQSLIDECFNFIFNNLNSLSSFPLKIQYYLKNNKDDIIWDTQKILDKMSNFLFHQSEFNLQQAIAMEITDKNNNIGVKKIDAILKVNNVKSPILNYINFQEYLLQLNNETYSPITNQVVNDFPFPYDEKLDFFVNIPLKFVTFFKYNINFTVVEHTNSPIIGEKNNLIKTEVNSKNTSDVVWVKKDKILLSYDQIKQFYIDKNFNFEDYESLINEGEKICYLEESN